MFTTIIVTKDKYAIDDLPQSAIIDPKKMQGTLKEVQKVIAVGDAVRNVKVGDMVCINPVPYAKYGPYKPGDGMRVVINGQEKKLLGYDIPPIEIDNVEYMMIQERDVVYVVEEWEDVKPASDLILPDKSLIL